MFFPLPCPPPFPLSPPPPPLSHPPLGFLALHLRLEALRYFPLLRDFLAALPHAGSEAREISGSQSGGFEHFRTHHGDAEQVRLELHHQIIRRPAAVAPQLLRCRTALLL